MSVDDFPTKGEIAKLDDLFEAIDICEDHDVDYTDIDDITGIKERLIMELDRRNGDSYREQVDEAMVRAGEEDSKKRTQLMQMFEELISVVGVKDETACHQFVEEFLLKDGTTTNILDDCEARMKNLRLKEAVLMVAGESSAGKSSFLNLLFGEDILPSSTLSCTSTITTVRYGERKTATIVYMNEQEKDEVMDLAGEGLIRFHDTVFQQKRDREHNIKEVKVTLPLNFLKSGLVLADTPGIGENDFLEEYLIDYIAKHEILGFIYLIFTDAAGGVKEDRLLNLLKLVMKQEKNSSKAFPFDPKATLFVANRFDGVPPESRDAVKKHVLEKLRECWPSFEDSMVVFFSTMLSKRDVTAHPSYISTNYRQLLQSFSGLFYYVLDRRLRVSYKWIEHVLRRMRHCMKTAVCRLGLSERDNHTRTKASKRRLQKLQQEADSVIKTIRADVQIKSTEIMNELKQYLSSPLAELRLCAQWTKDEIPAVDVDIQDAKHWAYVKERIDDAFYDRVCDEVDLWAKERLNLDEIESNLTSIIQEQLGVLEQEIISSEYDMCRRSNESRASQKRLSIKPSIVEMPVKMPNKASHRLSGFGRRKVTKKFTTNPERYVQERASKLLKRLRKNKKEDGADKGQLDNFVDVVMQRPNLILNSLEEKIPSLIDANIELLNNFEDAFVRERRYGKSYERMLEQIENLKQTLMYYGDGYVFVNDFKASEIRLMEDTGANGQSLTYTFRVKVTDLVMSYRSGSMSHPSLTPHGLWTFMSAGILHRDDTEKPIAIKVYMPSSGITNTFQEVAKLRCLIHTDLPLAEFMGIHHSDAQLPAYIFDGQLKSLQSFMNTGKEDVDPAKILEDVLHGLGYLHSKNMVHMELSANTITVNSNGEVKLSGACIPRKATLPLNQDTPVDRFVYLAPEVLTGDLYLSSADVYGFGLLVYEVVSGRKVFADTRTFPIAEFAKRIEPSEMLGFGRSHLSKGATLLIKRCVSNNLSDRPNSHVLFDLLKALNGQFNENADVAVPRARKEPLR